MECNIYPLKMNLIRLVVCRSTCLKPRCTSGKLKVTFVTDDTCPVDMCLCPADMCLCLSMCREAGLNKRTHKYYQVTASLFASLPWQHLCPMLSRFKYTEHNYNSYCTRHSPAVPGFGQWSFFRGSLGLPNRT